MNYNVQLSMLNLSLSSIEYTGNWKFTWFAGLLQIQHNWNINEHSMWFCRDKPIRIHYTQSEYAQANLKVVYILSFTYPPILRQFVLRKTVEYKKNSVDTTCVIMNTKSIVVIRIITLLSAHFAPVMPWFILGNDQINTWGAQILLL